MLLKFLSQNNFPRCWETSVMLAEGWWGHSFHNLDEPRKPRFPPNLFQPVTGTFALRPLLKINNKVQVDYRSNESSKAPRAWEQTPEHVLEGLESSPAGRTHEARLGSVGPRIPEEGLHQEGTCGTRCSGSTWALSVLPFTSVPEHTKMHSHLAQGRRT